MLDNSVKEYLEMLISTLTNKIDFAVEKMDYVTEGLDKKIEQNGKDIEKLQKVDGRVKVLEDNKSGKVQNRVAIIAISSLLLTALIAVVGWLK